MRNTVILNDIRTEKMTKTFYIRGVRELLKEAKTSKSLI